MKSYSGEPPPGEGEGINFKRLAIPHGPQFPRAPVQGELFHLDADIDGQDARLTFVKGLYFCPGFGGTRLVEQFNKRKAAPIGSQKIELEKLADLQKLPTIDDGVQIAATSFKLENRLTSVSGTASFWACLPEDGQVVVSVFRNTTLVAVAVDELQAKKARILSITFLDSPGVPDVQHVFSLRVSATRQPLYINQAKGFDFDGAAQTAFIVAENN